MNLAKLKAQLSPAEKARIAAMWKRTGKIKCEGTGEVLAYIAAQYGKSPEDLARVMKTTKGSITLMLKDEAKMNLLQLHLLEDHLGVPGAVLLWKARRKKGRQDAVCREVEAMLKELFPEFM